MIYHIKIAAEEVTEEGISVSEVTFYQDFIEFLSASKISYI